MISGGRQGLVVVSSDSSSLDSSGLLWRERDEKTDASKAADTPHQLRTHRRTLLLSRPGDQENQPD
jgi:hypothetical protein